MYTVYAHRGSSGMYPEHTRAAYLHALAEGADGIECDVHLSADEAPVCFHDSTLERTTNGSGSVASKTLSQLRRLDVVSWKGVRIPEQYGAGSEQVVTLEELIDLMLHARRPLGLAIELKHPSPFGRRLEESVLTVLMRKGWDPETSRIGNIKVSLMSFDPDAIDYLLDTVPGYHLCQLISVLDEDKARGLGLITRNAVRYLVRRVHLGALKHLDAGAAGIAGPGVAYAREHPEAVRRWVARGLRARVWTVNTEEDVEFLASLGVTEFTSDWPGRIRQFLDHKLEACA
ncbi:glycerophosphodiester phosphodiesterase [Kocuria polaris]|nr:glycerophosphodiester phosphodiesterase [Kocuria polaris]